MMMVLLSHASFATGNTQSTLGPYLSRFELAVPMFFMLSGFLLYRPYASAACSGRAPLAPRRFLRRRSLRIFPLLDGYRGGILQDGLPGAPARPIEVLEGDNRPQPRLDRDRGAGMTVTVGRIRPCEVHHLKMFVLSHNLVRGAAGAALLNAELAHARGLTARPADATAGR